MHSCWGGLQMCLPLSNVPSWKIQTILPSKTLTLQNTWGSRKKEELKSSIDHINRIQQKIFKPEFLPGCLSYWINAMPGRLLYVIFLTAAFPALPANSCSFFESILRESSLVKRSLSGSISSDFSNGGGRLGISASTVSWLPSRTCSLLIIRCTAVT